MNGEGSVDKPHTMHYTPTDVAGHNLLTMYSDLRIMARLDMGSSRTAIPSGEGISHLFIGTTMGRSLLSRSGDYALNPAGTCRLSTVCHRQAQLLEESNGFGGNSGPHGSGSRGSTLVPIFSGSVFATLSGSVAHKQVGGITASHMKLRHTLGRHFHLTVHEYPRRLWHLLDPMELVPKSFTAPPPALPNAEFQ